MQKSSLILPFFFVHDMLLYFVKWFNDPLCRPLYCCLVIWQLTVYFRTLVAIREQLLKVSCISHGFISRFVLFFCLTLQAVITFITIWGAQLFSWDRVGHSDLRQAETVWTAWNTASTSSLMHEVTFSQSCQKSKDLKQQQLSENP